MSTKADTDRQFEKSSNKDLFIHFYLVSASLQNVISLSTVAHGPDASKWCDECMKSVEVGATLRSQLSAEIERRDIGLNSIDIDSMPTVASASMH